MAMKALLFDCDGVIAETESDGHRVAFNETFKKEGIDAEWDMEAYGRLLKIGGGKERMMAYFRQDPVKYPESRFTAEYIEMLHREKTARFMELTAALPPRPGVRRLMMEAAFEGLQVFICSTSNEKSVTAMARSLLGDEMERVITHIFAGDVVKAKKPAPDIYLKVTEEYGVPAGECFVVEDSRIGLLAAKAAGMRCIITQSMYSKGEDFHEADAVVDHLGSPELPCHPLKGLPDNTKMVTLDTLRGFM